MLHIARQDSTVDDFAPGSPIPRPGSGSSLRSAIRSGTLTEGDVEKVLKPSPAFPMPRSRLGAGGGLSASSFEKKSQRSTPVGLDVPAIAAKMEQLGLTKEEVRPPPSHAEEEEEPLLEVSPY